MVSLSLNVLLKHVQGCHLTSIMGKFLIQIYPFLCSAPGNVKSFWRGQRGGRLVDMVNIQSYWKAFLLWKKVTAGWKGPWRFKEPLPGFFWWVSTRLNSKLVTANGSSSLDFNPCWVDFMDLSDITVRNLNHSHQWSLVTIKVMMWSNAKHKSLNAFFFFFSVVES